MSTAPVSEPGIRIHLLGRFSVEKDGALLPDAAWKRKRPVELLTSVALAPGRVLHKEEIIDRLWPDKGLDAGANNLYRTLHELRKTLGDNAVALDRSALRLASDVWIDVDAFEKAADGKDAATLNEAVSLYVGHLLPDDPYSDALGARREHLRQRFVDAGLRLVKIESDDERRIQVLRKIIGVDPTLEDAQRRLMQVLAEMGRKSDAIKQFRECVTALRERLDTAPSKETVALKEAIERDEICAKASGAAKSDVDWRQIVKRLVGEETPRSIRGREEALRQLQSLIEQGQGSMLLVGEAGMGKSRLASEAARLAREADATVLAGISYHLGGAVPYTPFVDAWSEHLRLTESPASQNPFLAFRPVPGASAQEDRLRLFSSVEQALVGLAGNSSVLILIEDLHEADESSLHLFHYLARAARHLPLMLLGSLREEELIPGNPVHELVEGLKREKLASRISLTRLDKAAVRDLIEDVSGESPPEPKVEAIFRLTAGNPYYTEEVVRAAEEDETTITPHIPTDLLETVRARVGRLGPNAHRLLTTASAMGERFDFETVRSAVGLDPSMALEVLDDSIKARIVEEDGTGYRFHHALTRQALYAALTHARRAFIHRAVADAIEAQGEAASLGRAEALAYHHQQAGQLDRAIPFLIHAMKRSQERLGFGEAVAFADQALEMMDAVGSPINQERFDLLLARGGMCVALGDLNFAVRDLSAAAALEGDGYAPSKVHKARALRLCGLALIEMGDLDAANEKLSAALDLIGDATDTPELSSLLYQFSQLRWHQARHAEAYDLAERCLKEAERLNDREAIAKGFEMLALACHSLGEWQEGLQYEEKRQQMADGTLDVASAFDVHL